MRNYYITDYTYYDEIGAALQRKRGETDTYLPEEMAEKINTIPSSVDGTDLPIGGIYLTKPNANNQPTEAHIINYVPYNNYEFLNILGYSYFPFLKKIQFTNCDRITSIGSYAFNGCSSLASIDLPDSITSIGGNAFINCSSLASIDLPDSITSIGGNAFQGCSSLASIDLPDSITSIGDAAFINCSSLASIDLPDSITSIGGAAFINCSSLASIDLSSFTNPNSIPALGGTALAGTPNTQIIYVANQEMLTAFTSATNWSAYASRFQIKGA